MSLLTTEALTKYFGDTHAVDHVDFSVREEELSAPGGVCPVNSQGVLPFAHRIFHNFYRIALGRPAPLFRRAGFKVSTPDDFGRGRNCQKHDRHREQNCR